MLLLLAPLETQHKQHADCEHHLLSKGKIKGKNPKLTYN